MQLPQSIPCAVFVALAILVLSSNSRAESHSNATPVLARDDYGYIFSDDPLEAGAFTPADPRIVLMTHANRAQLIRPRTAFVVELLKSVEHMP
jgi:hypothetical protein